MKRSEASCLASTSRRGDEPLAAHAMNTKLLDEALESVGYRRIRKGLYRFDSGATECEHLLAVEVHGKSDHSLTAEFGLRNPDAEAFAIDALRRYGDPVFERWSAGATGCVTWFSVGELLGWHPGAALWQRQAMDQEFAAAFVAAVASGVVPIVKSVDSMTTFLRVLLSNTFPYQWVKSNGAVRAAQIIFLACRQGTPNAAITASLQPYLREIEIGLGARRRVPPADYVAAVIADATRRVIH